MRVQIRSGLPVEQSLSLLVDHRAFSVSKPLPYRARKPRLCLPVFEPTGYLTSEVVNLQVTASIPIDCDFWSVDDGWKGLCKSLSVTSGGRSSEDAKEKVS
jgi:hypothetical protein